MGVKLSTKGLSKLAAANLADLTGPMKDNTDEQFVILRVVPVEDVKTRGVASTTTTVQIVGVEAALTPGMRHLASRLMGELTMERKRLSPQGEQQELDLDGAESKAAGEAVADDFGDL